MNLYMILMHLRRYAGHLRTDMVIYGQMYVKNTHVAVKLYDMHKKVMLGVMGLA